MYCKERKKVVKSIEFHLPKMKAILAIKNHLGYTTIDARDFYNKAVAGEYVGKNYEDIEHILYLNTFTETLSIEWEEAPLSEKELQEQEKLKAAEAWRDSLSEEDRAHYDFLLSRIPIAVAVAGG